MSTVDITLGNNNFSEIDIPLCKMVELYTYELLAMRNLLNGTDSNLLKLAQLLTEVENG